MLYVTRLELQNIRRFRRLEIDFAEHGSSALLVGDNGDGKSTVLRCLAMGLCDQSSAAALFREMSGEFRRHNSRGAAFIRVELENAAKYRYRIDTTFIDVSGVFERVEQKHYHAKNGGDFRDIHEDKFPWSRIFVSAYGPGIRTLGNADYSQYLAVDAVYSLFKYDSALQSPELAIRRVIDEGHRHSRKRGTATSLKLRRVLANLLHLKERAITLSPRGITVRGEWGEEDLDSLGDGYRATMTWTLDLMSWWLLNDERPSIEEFDPRELTGIVIIDELEQHLHPRWQRTILADIRDLFPKIQFVIATHSPLIASSCSDIAVHRLQHGRHDSISPYGWRAEDVYEMMGVPSSRAPGFEEDLEEFTRLDAKRARAKLNKAERKRLRRLRSELTRLPSNDPTVMMIELNRMAQSLKTDR